jgi:predicted membrane protein
MMILIVIAYDMTVYIYFDQATISDVISSYFVFEAHPLMAAGFGAMIGGLVVHFLGFIPEKEWIKGGRYKCSKCKERINCETESNK